MKAAGAVGAGLMLIMAAQLVHGWSRSNVPVIRIVASSVGAPHRPSAKAPSSKWWDWRERGIVILEERADGMLTGKAEKRLTAFPATLLEAVAVRIVSMDVETAVVQVAGREAELKPGESWAVIVAHPLADELAIAGNPPLVWDLGVSSVPAWLKDVLPDYVIRRFLVVNQTSLL